MLRASGACCPWRGSGCLRFWDRTAQGANGVVQSCSEWDSSCCSTQGCSPSPPASPAAFLRLSPSKGHLNEARWQQKLARSQLKAWPSFVCFVMCQQHPIFVLRAEGHGRSLFCQSAATSSSRGSVPQHASACHNTSTHAHMHSLSNCPDGETKAQSHSQSQLGLAQNKGLGFTGKAVF